jgi:putative membrane protein
LEDHKRLLKEVKGLAAKKMVTIPSVMTDESQDTYEKLNNESGKKFDQEYCKMMVDGHNDAISLFEKAAQKSTDPAVKDWAATTLSTLRSHLDHAMACKEKCEK